MDISGKVRRCLVQTGREFGDWAERGKFRRWVKGSKFGKWVKRCWTRVLARLFPPEAKTFDELFPSELKVVRKRRRKIQQAEDELPPFKRRSKILATVLRQLKRSRWQPRQGRQIGHNGLVGLALSGGGILSSASSEAIR